MSRLAAVAVTRRHLRELKRTPSRSNDLLAWPFIDTILFGSLGVFLSQQLTGQVDPSFVLSGLFLYHVVFQSSVALAVGFMSETRDRNLLNLIATPITAASYASGLALFGLIKMTIGLSVIVILAQAMFSYNVLDGGWALLSIVALLIVLGIGLSFCLISLQIRLGQSAEPITWASIVFITTISGAFYPVDVLPGFFQPIAHILPTTHAFAAGRALISGGAFPARDIVITAIGSSVTLALGAAALAWALRSFRRRGLVTRYS